MKFSSGSRMVMAAMTAAVCSVTLMAVLTSPRSEARSAQTYDQRVAECLIDNMGKAEVREAVPVIVDACLSIY